MEIKSLILGLCCTFGMFAVKNGIGVYYALARQQQRSARVYFLTAYSSGYFLLFMLMAYLARGLNPAAYMRMVQPVLQSGMTLHVIMAALLLLWGVYLLGHQHNMQEKTYGWLSMVLPCPVCLIVIGWSTAFLVRYAQDGAYSAVLAVFSGFMLLSFGTVFTVYLWGKHTGVSAHSLLGSSMIAISAYFLLSALILPQFADLESVYRLALSRPVERTAPWSQLALCIGSMGGLAASGFYFTCQTIRREHL